MDLVSADFWGFGVKFLRGILDFSVRNSRICAVHAGGIEIKMWDDILRLIVMWINTKEKNNILVAFKFLCFGNP